MAYPVNPPAMAYMHREHLRGVVYHEDGLALAFGFWFWEPERAVRGPRDWLVGPYHQKRSAIAARRRFVETQGEGPELRIWGV